MQATTAQKPGPDGWPKICRNEKWTSISDPERGIALVFEFTAKGAAWVATTMFRMHCTEVRFSEPIVHLLGMN